jgi:hypothetical protein
LRETGGVIIPMNIPMRPMLLRIAGKLTRRIFVWHYATAFNHLLAPNPNLESLVKDVRYYAAHGIDG